MTLTLVFEVGLLAFTFALWALERTLAANKVRADLKFARDAIEAKRAVIERQHEKIANQKSEIRRLVTLRGADQEAIVRMGRDLTRIADIASGLEFADTERSTDDEAA